MKRRPQHRWESLTPNYRARLQRRGISEADYLAGKSLTAARGHSSTPEHPGRRIPYVARAIAHGLINDSFVPADVWAAMTQAERLKVARDYEIAYFEKGRGPRLTAAERRKRGLLPMDRRVYRHRSHEQEVADVEFQILMVQLHEHRWGSEEWSDYRNYYYNTFSAA